MNILVIAAHPDDEVLGCGATIAKHSQQGDQINVLILAEGSTSRDIIRDREKHQTELSSLSQAAYKASKILGVNSIELLDFPDNRLDSCDLLDIVKIIEKAIHKYKPEVIYTHHYGDVNIDHQLINKAVITATRTIPNQDIKTVLCFEIPSSTEWQFSDPSLTFKPNWFVNISDTLNLKLQALKAYKSEMRPYPHPRSIRAVEYLARWRGSTIGVESAEAFVLTRHILDSLIKTDS